MRSCLMAWLGLLNSSDTVRDRQFAKSSHVDEVLQQGIPVTMRQQ